MKLKTDSNRESFWYSQIALINFYLMVSNFQKTESNKTFFQIQKCFLMFIFQSLILNKFWILIYIIQNYPKNKKWSKNTNINNEIFEKLIKNFKMFEYNKMQPHGVSLDFKCFNIYLFFSLKFELRKWFMVCYSRKEKFWSFVLDFIIGKIMKYLIISLEVKIKIVKLS